MSSISGINTGIMGSIMSTGMQSRTNPAEKFKQLDVDSSGTLDKTELSTLAKELSKMMGKTLDVDSSITTYDTDSDGALSQEEMGTMMKDTLGSPPEGVGGVSQRRAAADAYLANSGEDQLDLLRQQMERLTGVSTLSETDTDSPT